jgi:alginate O-acetyltransferase complex protein AlgI
MLLGGLWHGAAWTFVVWGAYHGALLSVYRRWPAIWDEQPIWAQKTFTFLLAVLGWTLFRAPTWAEATELFSRLLWPHPGSVMTGAPVLFAMCMIAGAIAHFGPNTFEIRHQWRPATAFGMICLVILCLAGIYGGQVSPFLYFQF